MDVTLVIAIFGAVTGAVSLIWQVASFLLTGGRVKVKLVSAWTGPGGAMKGVPGTWTPGQAPSPSFVRECLGVEVRNVGRLPVSVSNWSVEIGEVSLGYFADEYAPPVPYRLEAGASVNWLVDVSLVVGAAKALTKRGPAEIRAQATVADKEKRSSNKLTYPDDVGRFLPA